MKQIGLYTNCRIWR